MIFSNGIWWDAFADDLLQFHSLKGMPGFNTLYNVAAHKSIDSVGNLQSF